MAQKTVLFVSFYMYPATSPGAKRIANFASRLGDYGWKPIILSAAEKCVFPKDYTLSENVFRHIIRYQIPCGSIANHIANFNIRYPYLHKYRFLSPLNAWEDLFPLAAFNQTRWVWEKRALSAIKNICSNIKIDVIWLTIPPFPTIGLIPALSTRINRPIVLDIRDSWTLPRSRRENEWSPKFLEMAALLEKDALSNVKLCVFNARKAKELYAVFYKNYPSEFWHFIPNGFEPDMGLTASHKFDRFTLLHVGLISKKRNGDKILQAIKKLIVEGKIQTNRFQFLNIGTTTREFKHLIFTEGLTDCVRLIDFMPYRQCLEMEKAANWLLLLIGKKHSANVPSKIYEYLAVNRPILAVGPSDAEAREIVGRTKSGIFTTYNYIEDTLLKAYQHKVVFNPLEKERDKLKLNYVIKDVAALLERSLS